MNSDSSSSTESESENEILSRGGMVIRRPLPGQTLSSTDSDSDSGQPPRRRLRLSNPNSPSPEILIIRDCRVRVPRIFTIPDSPPNNSSTPAPPPVLSPPAVVPPATASASSVSASQAAATAAAVPSSSRIGGGISSRITTRSASAAAAATQSRGHPVNTISLDREPIPLNLHMGIADSIQAIRRQIWRPDPPETESDFSLSPIYSSAPDLAFTSSSLSSDADSDTTRSWVHRRLQRRNAIFMEELEPVDPEPAEEDGDVEDDGDETDSDEDDFGPFPPVIDNRGVHGYSISDAEPRVILEPIRNVPRTISFHPHRMPQAIDVPAAPPSTPTKDSQISNEPIPGPSKKLDDSTRSGDDDEGLTCLICYEPFTNSGEHRITCLKCGHTYGKACIEKWIKNERRCPQCNAKAVKKDVRILYVKHLKAIDTVERDKLLVDLERERESKRKLELECARLRQMNACRESDFVKLNSELRLLKDRVGGVYRDPGVSSSSEMISSTVNSKGFVQTRHMDFKDGEFRVGAYNEWLNMTAISQTLKNALYPQGCFGIKRINMLDLKTMQTTPIHQKEIRDLHFSKSQSDVLLSVGMDKKAILTNCQSNVIVQTFNTTQPLWSCTWNTMCQHLFYVGTNNGQIITYDLRSPQESVKVLTIPTEDKSPVARMHYITPSYQNSTFSLSGLIIQKLNSCWFCEIKNEKEIFHQLPIEGSFSSIDFEDKSRHMLISTRPSSKSPIGRHMVCELSQYYSDAQDCNICSCNVIQTYEGGPTGMGKMSRSSIFSPVDGTVLVGANGGQNTVNLWNVSDVNLKQTLVSRDPVLDFVPSQVNDNFLLNMITSNGLDVYKQM